MNRFNYAIIAVLLLANPIAKAQDDELTISTWGGAYETAQMKAYFRPFEQAHQVQIKLRPYNGGTDTLRLLDNPARARWDVVDMTESDAHVACKNRLITEFDRSLLQPAPDGTQPLNDFFSGSFLKCGIAHLSYATVLAYDERAFPTEKPNSVADFFDIDRFPGKRAIQRNPKAIMEWAMLSYNVPVRQIYDLLSTERGFRLVSHRLNKIKDHIVWWHEGHEPVELLRDGKVVMASGFNGRFFDARATNNIPITMIQDGQFLEMGVWTIHRQAARPDLAAKFIGFATRTESMATFSNTLPYGPTRESALERIGLNASTNVAVQENQSQSESASNRRIRADIQWYLGTETLRNRWFNEWLDSTKE